MSPEFLARLHAAAFADSRGWSADEFARLLTGPGVFVVGDPAGFALGRVVVDEAELLTLAVAPEARRKGFGRRLLAGFELQARALGAASAHLEVAADNTPAIALYQSAHYRETGRRPRYYARAEGPACDALTMAKTLA